jgi:hypothetical protein
VLLELKSIIPLRWTMPAFSTLFLLLCAMPGASQKTPDNSSLPAYDTHTETKVKGVVDEVNVLPLGPKKDFIELIIKSGNDKVHIHVCPKTFQDEMGVTFSKGEEIAVTGSKVKLESGDAILARELTRGTDTLVLRDDKGVPVWNLRTGK